MPDQHLVSFFIRWIHVLSMAFLFGGSVLLLASAYDSSTSDPKEWLAQLARRFEWIFWGAIGVQVITGIGNVGSFSAGLPSAASPWGAKLIVKLSLVLLFVLLSLVRTLVTVRVESHAPVLMERRVFPYLKSAYGLSAVFLLTIILLAEAMAHG